MIGSIIYLLYYFHQSWCSSCCYGGVIVAAASGLLYWVRCVLPFWRSPMASSSGSCGVSRCYAFCRGGTLSRRWRCSFFYTDSSLNLTSHDAEPILQRCRHHQPAGHLVVFSPVLERDARAALPLLRLSIHDPDTVDGLWPPWWWTPNGLHTSISFGSPHSSPCFWRCGGQEPSFLKLRRIRRRWPSNLPPWAA